MFPVDNLDWNIVLQTSSLNIPTFVFKVDDTHK